MRPTPPDYDTKAKLHLGISGSIVQWHEEKGYGFIRVPDTSEDIFFHANVLIAKHQAPQIGEHITVKAQYDPQKHRWHATEVSSPARQQAAAEQHQRDHALMRPMRDKLQIAAPIVLIWLLILTYFNPKLALCYAIISVIALTLYAWDKRCALKQSSRIPETSLHAIALLGGWSGALIARYLFRHKTQKQPFVGIFWITVAINILITLYLIFSGSLKD